MTEIDFFGHCFYAFMALGTWYLGKRDINGWWLRMFGNAGWIVLGFWLGLSSIWLWEILFLFLALRAYFEWKQEHDAQLAFVERITTDEEPNEHLKALAEECREADKFIRTTKFGVKYDITSWNYHSWMMHLNREWDENMGCWHVKN